MPTHLAHSKILPGPVNDVSDEAPFPGYRLACNHDAALNLGNDTERSFDFAELDAHATYLHLGVQSAKMNVAAIV